VVILKSELLEVRSWLFYSPARKMKQDGLEPEKIREYTQLSPEAIEKL
jgi:hypothetical protein